MPRRQTWNQLFSTGVWIMVTALVTILLREPNDEPSLAADHHVECVVCRFWPKEPITAEVAAKLGREREDQMARIRLARNSDER